jgi:Fe2+ or Zn2+ uptake regulation protein
MSSVDPNQFGPTQREVLRVLTEADDELTTREIIDRADRLSRASVRGAIERLSSRGIVSKRKYTNNGWNLYWIPENGGAGQ